MASPNMLKRALCLVVGLSATGCAKDVWSYSEVQEDLSVGGEIFRVFCKRTAKAEDPEDITGIRYTPGCDGKGPAPEGATERVKAIVARRDLIIKTVDRILGDDAVLAEKVIQQLEEDEITDFLKQLLPLYDGAEPVLPGASRAVGAMLARLVDESDMTGQKALDAFARITGRTGYRQLDLALGLIKTVFNYPNLDVLSVEGMGFLARGGKGEAELDEIAQGLALELAAYDASPVTADSTLRVARDFMLSDLYTYPGAEADLPQVAPIWVTRRDSRGVSLPNAPAGTVPAPFVDADGDGLADVLPSGQLVGNLPSPFKINGEAPNTPRAADGRALSGEQPLYDYFDASRTMTAAFLREDARLSVAQSADPNDRTTFEKFGRGLPALFGLDSNRSATFGKARVNFRGPDPAAGPIYDLTHAVGALAKHPDETRRLFAAIKQATIESESDIMQLIDTMLKMNEMGKQHPEAVLVGENGPGTPHRFWDDLISVVERMSRRPGMLEAVLRMITDPDSVYQDEIYANWWTYKDVAKYKGAPFLPDATDQFTPEQAADLNALANVAYKTLVDRAAPDVGENRSVWQRTMSLIHHLRSSKLCNKKGSTLPLRQALLGITLPIDGGSYDACKLFEIPDMVRIYSQSITGDAYINLKPDISALGPLTGVFQEIETQITGFNSIPTPEALARFLFAPPNYFSKALVDPFVTKSGARIVDLEPFALFAMEVKHPNAGNKSFIEAGKALLKAFESTELEKEIDDPDSFVAAKSYTLPDGYMFAELLNVFHMHWGSRRAEPCEAPTATSWTTCTQSADPEGKFFSYQTDIRSYEPLLARVFGEVKFIHSLATAAKALDKVKVDEKTGLTILADFVNVLVKADPTLEYRAGGAPRIKRDGGPAAANTAITNVGDEVGYVSPLYLILDGLKRIDTNFAATEHSAKQAAWHQGRSEIVDLFLTVEDVNGKKRLKDRVGYAVFLRTLDFVNERIAAHQAADDVEEWANGLAARAVTFFDTPLIAGVLHLLDKSWDSPKAGKELLRLIVHLVDENKNPEGFRTTVIAAADLFQLLEDTNSIAPLLHLASESVAPGVSKAVNQGGSEFSPNDGILRRSVELLKETLRLHERRPSTLSRVLKNLVATAADGKSPLETLIDVISEVERTTPEVPASKPLVRADFANVSKSAHEFMMDKDHGLERLFDVIKNRKVKVDNTPAPVPASNLQEP